MTRKPATRKKVDLQSDPHLQAGAQLGAEDDWLQTHALELPFELRFIPLCDLYPDPDQPRKLAVSLEDLAKGPHHGSLSVQQQAELKELDQLADDIFSEHQLDALHVVNDGQGRYRIVNGERRFCAMVRLHRRLCAEHGPESPVAGRFSRARCNVYTVTPSDLLGVQLRSNTSHKPLSVTEVFSTLEALVKQGRCFRNARAIETYSVGLSYDNCKVLNLALQASEETKVAIRDGRFTSYSSLLKHLTRAGVRPQRSTKRAAPRVLRMPPGDYDDIAHRLDAAPSIPESDLIQKMVTFIRRHTDDRDRQN